VAFGSVPLATEQLKVLLFKLLQLMYLLVSFIQPTKIKPNIMRKFITRAAIAVCFFTACKSNSGSPATSDSTAAALKRNKQTALNAVIALSKRDVDGFLKDCTADYADLGDGSNKPITNKDTLKAALKDFLTTFPDFTGKNFVALADSNTVIITGEWSGTFKGANGADWSTKPNGRSFKIPEAYIFTFDKTGKITLRRSIQSSAALSYQLGLLVPAKK
jgi:hypothetical protein